MKHLMPKIITTVSILFLLINLTAAIPPARLSARADGPSPKDAAAVSPVLDEARAVKQVISAGGGQITATAADGTRFTLVVPPQALLSEVEITMTPVAQVGQFPLSGGLAAAVQLEPEGLLLWEPASLTIEPAVPVPVPDQLSFTWHERGERFHLYPLQVDPSSITMNLVHFSGYGVGRGTDAEADELPPLPQEDELFPLPQDKLESETEKKTRRERKERDRKQLTKKKIKKRDRQLCADFSLDAIRRFDALKKKFEAALDSQDEGVLRCALNEALVWERFLKIERAFSECASAELSAAHAVLADFRSKALRILSDKAYERCGRNVAEALRLIKLAKEAQGYLLEDVANEIGEKAKRCARFELQFESVTESPVSVVHVRATVPIQYEPGKIPLAESPLEHVSFSVKDPSLRAGGVQGSTFQVVDMEFDLNLRDDKDCSGANEPEATLVSMTIWPGTPWETIIDNEGRSIRGTFWVGAFAEFHEMEFDAGRGGFVISGWSKGQNQLLARKTYVQSNSLFSEGTALNLFHRPE